MSTDRARRLSDLLAPAPSAEGGELPSVELVRSWVDARLAAHGCTRPEPGADDEADVRHALHWLLRMAERTYRRLLDPAREPDPQLLARFSSLLEARPGRDDTFAQLHIDAASSLRRAAHVRAHLERHPGPVLAVGDDDAVTLALTLMGVPSLFAVDLDERVLAFLSESAARVGARIEVERVDVLEEPVPERLRRGCAAVVTDPIRSLEPSLGFLLFGAAAMRRDGPARLFWADHPDWSFEHGEVVETLARAGLVLVEVHEDEHAYPLDARTLDLPRLARELSLDPEWLRALTLATSAWSSLYVLERAPRR